MKIKCPKCGKETSIDLSSSVSDDGEVYRCNNCNWSFRYVDK